jgi:hypothetical protein
MMAERYKYKLATGNQRRWTAYFNVKHQSFPMLSIYVVKRINGANEGHTEQSIMKLYPKPCTGRPQDAEGWRRVKDAPPQQRTQLKFQTTTFVVLVQHPRVQRYERTIKSISPFVQINLSLLRKRDAPRWRSKGKKRYRSALTCVSKSIARV